MGIHSFRDMEVWKQSNSLSCKVFNISETLPRSEDYALKSQIRKSANSVSANIAEAFGRHSKKDKINFYIISRGSAFETQNHLLYGKGVCYFKDSTAEQFVDDYESLILQLNKIMKTLRG